MKKVSRKLFSSEQASDGREAHRGSVTVTNSRADCAITQQMIHRLHHGHPPLREERVGRAVP